MNLRAVALAVLLLPLIASCQDAGGGREQSHPSAQAREEEVRFSHGAIVLAGTLFRPAGPDESPAVVVLAGSDRSARGELRIALARRLAAEGVAALVYDSPGTGFSEGNAVLQSRADRVAEARSAAAFLKRRPGIRPSAVGLLGGSEGANVALIAASGSDGVAFVVAVSGSLGVPVLDVLRYSAMKKGGELGLSPVEIAQATAFKEIAFSLLGGSEIAPWASIESNVEPWDDPAWSAFIALAKQRGQKSDAIDRQAFRESLRGVVAHFAARRWFVAVDEANALERMLAVDADRLFSVLESGRFSREWETGRGLGDAEIRVPVLAIWGAEDSFLPPEQCAASLRKHFEESRHPDFEVAVFTGATHFLTRPGSRSELVPGYLDMVVHWIDKRFGR